MTLARRLSAFFLLVLGIVLILICASVLIATHYYFQRQTNRALSSALNTLVAAIEVVPEGVEWEPAERTLIVERGPFGQEISWLLVDAQGRQVDGSLQESARATVLAAADGYPLTSRASEPRIADEHGWRIAQRWLTPERLHPELAYRADEDPKYRALGITVAIATRPIGSLLAILGIGMLAASSLAWVLVALAGERIGRRMLRPIRQFAELASRLNATTLTERLPPAPSGDELHMLAVSINGMLDRLQESCERQQRFTGDAAHQLRTPLTAMRGQLEVALRRDRSADEYRQALAGLRGQTLRLHDIVESLLFLARADDEAMLTEMQLVEVSAWLAERLAGWQAEYPTVEVQARSCNVECWVRVQPVLLGELVNILLDNAARYRDPGTPIPVELALVGGAVTLTVDNAAAGLDGQDLSRLFEPFHRCEDARRRGIEGLGLGLAISRRIAETLHGRIGASIDAHHHVRFTVELPLASPAAIPAATGRHGIG